uniref:hypothetical protein n=1 Tax=Altererythrobacter segetis TaxID=1104773 RepID=UPI0014080553|nr:hypothetical protein [Altererythrobacter segetis]
MIGKAAMAGIAAGALALASVGSAQDLSPELQALDAKLPGTLINDPSSLDWKTQGLGFKSKGVTDPAIPGGGAAVQFEIRKADPKPYTIQAFVPLLSTIAKGDTVTIGFYARALSADTTDGKGVVNVRFQQNSDPWPGFGDAAVKVGSEWEWHEASGISNINIAKEVAVVALQLAGAKQTIQIGQAIVVKGASAIAGAADPSRQADAAIAALKESVDLPPPLKDAGRLIDRPDVRGWGNSGPAGSIAELDDKTIWLGKATRFTVTQKGQNRWDVGTAIQLREGIAVGDKLLIAVAAKTVSASTADGKALVGVRVQSSDPPHEGFADHLVAVGPNWQLIRLNTTATQAIPEGKAEIALHFAEAPQVVDIGPVYVFKVP